MNPSRCSAEADNPHLGLESHGLNTSLISLRLGRGSVQPLYSELMPVAKKRVSYMIGTIFVANIDIVHGVIVESIATIFNKRCLYKRTRLVLFPGQLLTSPCTTPLSLW